MPGNILNADTMFPSFRETETSEEKLNKVTNYLYMLLEQLRYSLNNLDADNFNDTGLREIGEGIARPLQTSFASEFAKTNALIEGISDEFGSQIRLLTDWVGTDDDGNLISSAASITAAADKNKSDIVLLTKRVEGDEAALADYKISVGNTYAMASSLTTFQNSVNKSLTDINQTASDQGALIELVAYYDDDNNPKLNAASIALGVSEDEDFINLIASKVNITADMLVLDSNVYITGMDGNETMMKIMGNRIWLNHIRNADTGAGLSWWYDGIDTGSVIGGIRSERDTWLDDDMRYSLRFEALRTNNDYPCAVILFAEGAITHEAGTRICLTAPKNVRIEAQDSYFIACTTNFEGIVPNANSFVFCTDGIYYTYLNSDDEIEYVCLLPVTV